MKKVKRWRGTGVRGRARAMPTAPKSPAAGGVLIAAGPIVGAVIGAAFGEATPGALIGLGLAVAAAIALWLRSR